MYTSAPLKMSRLLIRDHYRAWCAHTFFVQSQQACPYEHRRTGAPGTFQKMADRRLTARHESREFLLCQPCGNQFGGDLLDVHRHIITYVFRTINTFVMNFFITIVI